MAAAVLSNINISQVGGVFDRPTRECFCEGSSGPRCQSDRRRSRWSVPSRQETLRSRPSIRPTKSGSQRSISGWPAAGPRRGRFKNANLPHGASSARRSRRIARLVRGPCEAICFRAAERDGPRSAKPQSRREARTQEAQAMARHVLLELELDQAGVARGTRRDRTVRAPRSRSHCSCRPHL